MPVSDARQIGTLRRVPRSDRLLERHMHPPDSTLKSHGMTMTEPHGKAVEIQIVEVALSYVPANILAMFCGPHRQVEMLLV